MMLTYQFADTINYCDTAHTVICNSVAAGVGKNLNLMYYRPHTCTDSRLDQTDSANARLKFNKVIYLRCLGNVPTEDRDDKIVCSERRR